MTAPESDVLVVGTGFAGLLVAGELVEAGRHVTLVERGGFLSHAEQALSGRHEVDHPAAAHNHEVDPETPYFWDYTYGVGGSSLHWTGAAPRLLPSDFELRTRFGVGRDWPIGYDELVPYYQQAERVLAVAAGPNPLFGDAPIGAHPAHPLSPADELLAPLLPPLHPLAQARLVAPLNGRPACCGVATCRLCPVDSRFSMLHFLEDSGLLSSPRVTLRDRTVVSRVRVEGGRAVGVQVLGPDGDVTELDAATVVLAANGIENPGILLRSGLDGPHVGRWLYDHGHRMVRVRIDRPAGHGRGRSMITGASYAYAEGEWRAERGAQLVMPFNPGIDLHQELVGALARGDRGGGLHDAIRDVFDHTLVLDTVGEDLPIEERRVELSARRDALGLPLNRVRYPADSSYVEAGRGFLYEDLEKRLEPLGGRIAAVEHVALGAHSLGTCFMGDADGVVDRDCRHHEIGNLYVTGGSTFPTYSSHHPTLTICALALRLGRHLGGERA